MTRWVNDHAAHVEAWQIVRGRAYSALPLERRTRVAKRLFDAGVEPGDLAVLSDAECVEAVRGSACGPDKEAGARAVREAAARKRDARRGATPRAVPS